MGSTSLTTDSSGAVVSEVRYLPYGQERWTNEVASPADFGFTSQRAERGFGLYDYKARYYSPVLGRFISPDSIVPEETDPQHWNRYSYVYNNPLKHIDPTGHCGGPVDVPVEGDGGGLDDDFCDGGGSGGGRGGPTGSGRGGTTGHGGTTSPSGGAAPSSSGKSSTQGSVNAGTSNGGTSGTGNSSASGNQNATSTDLYATGNSKGPRDPRIENYNLKEGQKPDIKVDENGQVIPNQQGGASTYQSIDQLPTRGHVWKLPQGSKTPGFDVVPDGIPYGNQPAGHHSLVPNTSMSPMQCIECFRGLPWQPVLKPDGNQLKLK